MTNNFFIDVVCKQIFFSGERISGDSFLCRHLESGRRTVAVLSDGLGHGVKANILSTLTSAILVNFVTAKEDITSIARMILKTLPVCSVRKISYSTFTIVDIDNTTGKASIVEYDNPHTLIFRGETPLDIEWETLDIVTGERTQTIHKANMQLQDGDRLVVVSDGVAQSGQREGIYKFGWGSETMAQMISYLLSFNKTISSHDLALQVLSKASHNDHSRPSDDMSCAVMHVRVPRRLMLISCPPATKDDYPHMISHIDNFNGERVICGYPVAEIIADIRGTDIQKGDLSPDPLMPPTWKMKGFDLVTEGIITLNRVADILEHNEKPAEGAGAAQKVCRMLLRSDYIEFVVGTKRNLETGQYMPDEFELRRNVLRRIATLLKTRFSKQVALEYV